MSEIKTYRDWEKSNLDLDDYLTEPCEIDEELANYIGECVAPVYITPEFCQGGDPVREESDVFFYRTVAFVDDRYFNLGILPEFKQ